VRWRAIAIFAARMLPGARIAWFGCCTA